MRTVFKLQMFVTDEKTGETQESTALKLEAKESQICESCNSIYFGKNLHKCPVCGAVLAFIE